MRKRCVISGASGLIGSHLVPAFPTGWELYGLSRRPPHWIQTHEVTPDCLYHHIPMDLSREWDVDHLPKQVDTVIHFAQSENFRNFPESSEEVFTVNTLSTLRLLEYARKTGAKNFILASSGGIYGFGSKPFSESDSISIKGDIGFYLGTKYCSEILADSYAPYLNVIVLRFFFVYGPHQNENLLIPRLLRSVQTGKSIQLQGEQGPLMNPIYVADAVQAILKSAELNRSEKINVAGPEVLSLKSIVEQMGLVVGIEPRFEYNLESAPLDIIADIQKMNQILGHPVVSVREGLSHYLQSQKQTIGSAL